MNGNRLFADTNIILYFLQGKQEVIDLLVDKELLLSEISEIELLSFPNLSVEQEKELKSFISECTVVGLNQEVKNLTIALRKSTRQKVPDTIIAASAIYHKVPLITADKNFSRFEMLDLILFEV
jgi:hypothetical protein